jgi:hypothetical protein
MRQMFSVLCPSLGLTRREWFIISVSVLVALCSSAALAFFFPKHDSPPSYDVVLHGPFRHLNNSYSFTAIFNRPEFEPDSGSFLSTLLLYENNTLLGPAHATLDDIARKGGGRYLYSIDRPFTLIFSTSDHSDPNSNGRTYRVFDPSARDPYAKNLRR